MKRREEGQNGREALEGKAERKGSFRGKSKKGGKL